MNVIIIDDERLARENIENRLKKFFPNLSLIGKASNVADGLLLIQDSDLDILFLDIKMSGASGFDLLEQLEDINFEIIFVSAYDEYALKAFEFNAMGYILKPIINEKFINAVNLAISRRTDKSNAMSYKYLLSNMKSRSDQSQVLTINSKEGIYFLKLSDLLYLEADGRYTKLHQLNGKITLSSQNLAHFINLVCDKGFFHVHKSYIVNTTHIVKYDNEGFVLLGEAKVNVPVSRRKKQEFLTSLGLE